MSDLWMPGATREPQAGGVTLNTSLPPRATWHITWDALTNGVQPPFENVSNYLKRVGYCPHIMWDPFTGKIVQYYPANVGGRALNAWNEDGAVNIQVEIYFTPGVTHEGKVYNTVAETPGVGFAELLTWMDGFGIPRTWPMGAPAWQGNSRDANVWNENAGHYGHCNVPNNTHSDPGPMLSLTGVAPVQPPTPQPPTTSGKTINELATEVIAGLHGNGAEREASLGSQFTAVQAEVNRRYGASTPPPAESKSIDQLVEEVNMGLHGNGADREASLGANYAAVQNEINRRAGIGAGAVAQGPNISQLADAVIRGDFGDGPARAEALGANYDAVQAEVNRRYGV